jgi:predicted extracellular nuclease
MHNSLKEDNMTKRILLMTLFASLSILALGLSIYDIQYTSFPGSDNTYPSPYAGKRVSTEGIVTAIDYKAGGYFISEAVAGPYSGLLIIDRSSQVRVGDRVLVSGTVRETFGMTTLQDISSTEILERNHPLPHPVILTTAQLTRAMEAEAYEGVYARILSVSSSSRKTNSNRLQVSDGTGLCSVSLGSFASSRSSSSRKLGSQFSSITGIVTYSFGEFSLNPITDTDIVVNQPVSIQNRSWGRIKSIYK